MLTLATVIGTHSLAGSRPPESAAAPVESAAVGGPPPVVDRNTLPRTIVTTDGENDDFNSFMRLLYYTNDIDVEGLVYSSSVHHWKGDGVHTLKQAKAAGIITSFMGETQHGPCPAVDVAASACVGDRAAERRRRLGRPPVRPRGLGPLDGAPCGRRIGHHGVMVGGVAAPRPSRPCTSGGVP